MLREYYLYFKEENDNNTEDLDFKNVDFVELYKKESNKNAVADLRTELLNKEFGTKFSNNFGREYLKKHSSDTLNYTSNKYISFFIYAERLNLIIDDKVFNKLDTIILKNNNNLSINFNDEENIIYYKEVWNNSIEDIEYYIKLYIWLKNNFNTKLQHYINAIDIIDYNKFISLLYNVNFENNAKKLQMKIIDIYIYNNKLIPVNQIKNAITFIDSIVVKNFVYLDIKSLFTKIIDIQYEEDLFKIKDLKKTTNIEHNDIIKNLQILDKNTYNLFMDLINLKLDNIL